MIDYMNEKEPRKRDYVSPTITVINLLVEQIMQTVSGQHTRIGQGSGGGDAKENIFEEVNSSALEENQWEE